MMRNSDRPGPHGRSGSRLGHDFLDFSVLIRSIIYVAPSRVGIIFHARIVPVVTFTSPGAWAPCRLLAVIYVLFSVKTTWKCSGANIDTVFFDRACELAVVVDVPGKPATLLSLYPSSERPRVTGVLHFPFAFRCILSAEIRREAQSTL